MMFPGRERDSDPKQFENLDRLFGLAKVQLNKLKVDYPDLTNIWNVASTRMEIIHNTIESKIFPPDEMKKKAELGPMLVHECRAVENQDEISSLFELDNAYQLMGIKELTDDDL